MTLFKCCWRGAAVIAGFAVLLSAAHAQEAKRPGAKEWFDKGVVLQEAGNVRSSDAFRSAVQELNIIISGNGANEKELSSAYALRARCYSLLGDNRRALADLDKAIELAPEDGDIYYLRSFIHEIMGHARLSVADLKMSAQKKNEKARAELNARGVQ